MTWQRSLTTGALVFAVAVSACGETDSSSANTPTDTLVATPTMDEDVADQPGLSASDDTSLADSGPILDFLTGHADDPAFGAIWTTDTPTYQVHVRYLEDSILSDIATLEGLLNRKIERHTGGATASELDDLVGRFAAASPTPSYNVNHQLGRIDIYADSDNSGLSDDELNSEHTMVVTENTPTVTPDVLEP